MVFTCPPVDDRGLAEVTRALCNARTAPRLELADLTDVTAVSIEVALAPSGRRTEARIPRTLLCTARSAISAHQRAVPQLW